MRTLLFIAALMALSPAALPAKECVKGGCSDQFCLEKGQDMASTCEWTEAYGCYNKHGECVTLPDGNCGWKENDQLTQCLKGTYNTPGGAIPFDAPGTTGVQ
jgi:hypothetical protein